MKKMRKRMRGSRTVGGLGSANPMSLVGCGLLGAALVLANNANSQAVTSASPSTEPTAQCKVVFAAPVSVAWAQAYPHAAANLSATNADGWNNLQKMTELLPPDDQSTVVPPGSTAGVIRTSSANALGVVQKRQQLLYQPATLRAAAAQNQAALQSRAKAAGISSTVDLGGGKVGTLVDIDETGQPTYVSANDIYAAATTHADQLWPAGSVTAVSGWTSGSSGLDLDGSGQLIDMFEADYTTGNAGVETAHEQLVDPIQQQRVTQGDSTGLSPHATAVAGVLISGGFNDVQSSVNYGNYSRGIGYAGTVPNGA